MFFINYISAELRRRKGRTILTALGLAVGVGLVVVVSALSDGLDKAQDEVLEPLTGVGTDMSVSRPLRVSGDGDRFSAGPGRSLGAPSSAGSAKRMAVRMAPRSGCRGATPATSSSATTWSARRS